MTYSAKLPVSNLVKVSINLASTPAQAQSLSNLLVLGTSDVIDTYQRIRSYSTLAAVVADFGAFSEEYYSALEWFGQSPQPGILYIGRWADVATSAKLIGSTRSTAQKLMSYWAGITTGGFTVTIDGVVDAITGLNFSAQTNLNGVASVISTALVTATCVWNEVYSRFEIKSHSTGITSTLSFLTAPATGVDISGALGLTLTSSGAYEVSGVAAEQLITVVSEVDNRFGQQWYALFVPSAIDAEHLAVAAYIEASNTKHAYGVNTNEAGVLSSVDTANIAYQLKALAYRKTCVQYSSNSSFAVVSLLARILTTDYNANKSVITLMYKTEPGVVAESLAQSQMDALLANNCNVFVNYDNSTAIIQPGVVASGDFMDTIFGCDWLAIDVQNRLYNLLYSNPTKIPQTNEGNGILATGIMSSLEQAVANGLVAPGQWDQSGFGTLRQGDYLSKGYYVYAPDISLQNPADRAARKSVPFQVAAKLAGAVHTVSVMINVNR
jgi:hypothetical protein